jgi:hypothetical protein
MKFCPVVPEICHGQVHGPQKERRRKRRKRKIIIIKIIIRNGAKTIGDLNIRFLARQGLPLRGADHDKDSQLLSVKQPKMSGKYRI